MARRGGRVLVRTDKETQARRGRWGLVRIGKARTGRRGCEGSGLARLDEVWHGAAGTEGKSGTGR